MDTIRLAPALADPRHTGEIAPLTAQIAAMQVVIQTLLAKVATLEVQVVDLQHPGPHP